MMNMMRHASDIAIAAIKTVGLAVLLAYASPAISQNNPDWDASIGTNRAAYAQAAQSGTYQTSSGAINQVGNSSIQCQKLRDAQSRAAMENAARQVPPNPTTVLANNTCLGNVMQIQIPQQYGVVGSVVGSILQSLTGSGCSNATNSWGGIGGALASGDLNRIASAGASMAAGQIIPMVGQASTGPLQGVATSAAQSTIYSGSQVVQQQVQQRAQQNSSQGTTLLDSIKNIFN